MDPDDLKNSYRFFIKWKGWSHRHDSWLEYDSLIGYPGLKKVDNFIRSVVEDEWRARTDASTTQEDLEHLDIRRELERRQLAEYCEIERVIGMKEVEVQYLCKWKGLPYGACTWEPSIPSTPKTTGKEHVKAFWDRELSTRIPSNSTHYPLDRRPRYREIKEQPAYLGNPEADNSLQLRDYQLRGLNWIASRWASNGNGILADEMGLGKTVQTVSGLSYLMHEREQYGAFLVVVPLSTIGSWAREFQRWAPDMNVVMYVGDATSRRCIREFDMYSSTEAARRHGPLKINVLLTTYELVLKDRAILGEIPWSYLAVDEAHRLKNTASQLHETLVSHYSHANCLLITGTPMQNNLEELYALLRFLSPDTYTDVGMGNGGVGGDEDEDRIRELREALGPLMLRRVKKDVETSMPRKFERILRVELSPLQEQYYRAIISKNFDSLSGEGGGGVRTMSLLNVAMELKKAANHPFLFPGAEEVEMGDSIQEAATASDRRNQMLRALVWSSGKMVLLDKLLTRLRDNGHRVLIFSQMVRLLDILHDYLALKGIQHQRLDGSVSGEARRRAIADFNAPGSSDFCFLLSTRAGGLGLNLETADTVVIFDSDWNPQNDLQAMARAHRIGQTREVHVYRFVSKGTIEEEVVERARRKMILEYCILQGGSNATGKGAGRKKVGGWDKEEWNAILKFGAQSLFASSSNTSGQGDDDTGTGEGDEGKKSVLEEMDLDEVLARAEERDRSGAVTGAGGRGAIGGMASDFMQQFIVSDFQPSWEDIVPVEERGKNGGGSTDPGIDQEDEESEEEERGGRAKAKKRGKEQSSANEEGRGQRKRRKVNGENALTERDVRMLIRAVQRYGEDLEDPRRQDAVLRDARIQGKSIPVLQGTLQDLRVRCRDALKMAASDPADGAMAEVRIRPGEETEALVGPMGGRRAERAVPIIFHGVTVNALHHLRRCGDLAFLSKLLLRLKKDMEGPGKLLLCAPTGWTPIWGPRQDGALMVGVDRHGFGQWELMAGDEDLGLGTYMHVGPQSGSGSGDGLLPRALNVQRRAEAVLRFLQGRFPDGSKRGRGEDWEERSLIRQQGKRKARESPDTQEVMVKRSRGGTKRPRQTASPGSVTKKLGEEETKTKKLPPLTEEQIRVCKEELRPVKKHLRWLQDEAPTAEPAAKVKGTTKAILQIGRYILEERRRVRQEALWSFVVLFWPSPIQPEKLSDLYTKLEKREEQARHSKDGAGNQ
ncbi:P-loop containing nucleoside triphosphate hydrolase protein [Piptocephalis cylindrospora]|uniref:P-loop containing nucleoside triphosphate hydrolase protein n=1 Tax=Piptocephalis cylindrospora TaxID=1907219 RepID=A0A4P9Y4S9_9FUNG|nr:P-loop containing nucleoside triphosphate hydrolase protein [Piptocephalis cylindrospora]|eukprot:RKP13682.1 P-loop containing nucleoside triphosphate hydrolase protein [Piptocephalis cylindrospora]